MHVLYVHVCMCFYAHDTLYVYVEASGWAQMSFLYCFPPMIWGRISHWVWDSVSSGESPCPPQPPNAVLGDLWHHVYLWCVVGTWMQVLVVAWWHKLTKLSPQPLLPSTLSPKECKCISHCVSSSTAVKVRKLKPTLITHEPGLSTRFPYRMLILSPPPFYFPNLRIPLTNVYLCSMI